MAGVSNNAVIEDYNTWNILYLKYYFVPFFFKHLHDLLILYLEVYTFDPLVSYS